MKKLLLIILAVFACNAAIYAQVDGDVNGDGIVTSADVTVLYNFFLNNDSSELVNGDVSGDGYITSADITYVYNILLGVPNIVNPPAPVTEYTVNGVTFKMVEVEGGTFMIGSEQMVGNAYPAHEVTLSTYSIGQTEVTQELWVAVMGSNPSYFNEYGNAEVHSDSHSSWDAGINLQRPVDSVNYGDCLAFCAKLNEMTGLNFRLPTEAEWEFAARGGNQSQGYEYSGSNNLDDVAWYWYSIPSRISGNAEYGTQTVATKAPNELGLYDMSGNVWEWCQDYWGGIYSSEAQTNPVGPSTGDTHVYRGGSWGSYKGCRVSYRVSEKPTFTLFDIGLRLAL